MRQVWEIMFVESSAEKVKAWGKGEQTKAKTLNAMHTLNANANAKCQSQEVTQET
jgi:hypothetical protein